MDPDQAQQNVGPDLDPNCLTLLWYSQKNYFEKKNIIEISDDKKAFKITQYAKGLLFIFRILVNRSFGKQ